MCYYFKQTFIYTYSHKQTCRSFYLLQAQLCSFTPLVRFPLSVVQVRYLPMIVSSPTDTSTVLAIHSGFKGTGTATHCPRFWPGHFCESTGHQVARPSLQGDPDSFPTLNMQCTKTLLIMCTFFISRSYVSWACIEQKLCRCVHLPHIPMSAEKLCGTYHALTLCQLFRRAFA